jgi:histone-lysine N-methyltransferase SETMAR
LKEKCHRQVTKGVLFLHNNSPANRALASHEKRAHLGIHCLDHTNYSLYLAPLDYQLFPELKKQLKGRHFLSDKEVIAAVEIWLAGKTLKFFLSGLRKLVQQATRCIEVSGEYVK